MRTRLAAVLAAAATTTAGLAGAASAISATAGPVIVIHSQGAIQNPSNNTVYGHAVSLDTADGSALPAGSTAAVTWSSCGQVLQSATYGLDDSADGTPGTVAFVHYFSLSGSAEPMGNAITDRIGPVLDWSATINAPGYDPYVVSNSYSGYTVKRPSCEQILAGDVDGEEPVTVQKWSVKKGAITTAKVGKSLGVTPTRAPGAKVTYAWKVGTKTVDRDRVFFVKRVYKGKKVTVRIAVTKPGAKPVSRTLRYGKAR